MTAPAPYLRLRQVCLAAPSLGPAVAAVQAVLGLPVCHRDPALAKYGLVNALFVCGAAFLEIVAPIHEGQGGTACERFIAKNADAAGQWGGYMAIFDCDDPLARRAHAQTLGIRIAHVLDYPGFRGTQLHPVDCRATMLEFDHTDGGEALDGPYWPAGAHWLEGRRADGASGLPVIELESPDPTSLASHWARLVERPLAKRGGDLLLGFELGEAQFRPGPAERLASLQVQVPDPPATLRRAASHGLPLVAHSFVLAGTRIKPVR